MKTVWKIIQRVLLGLLLTVYIVVALVNYSVVQSYAGAWVGNYFSKEWGGKVAIGSLHAMPWDHLILDHVLWVSPTDDTLFRCESLRVLFDRFPFYDNTLDMKRVTLRNTYYHLAIGEEGINLKFVIDYFKPEHPSPSKEHAPFTVKVGTLELDRVHYKMDLTEEERKNETQGAVEIPHMEFFDIRAKIKDVKVVNDDISCYIVRFSTRERSGFELKELSGKVHVGQQGIKAEDMKIRTNASHIETDAELSYDGWQGISGYVSTVHHEVELKEGTKVSMGDVAYWAPVLESADYGVRSAEVEVEAVGKAHGTIDSLWTDMHVRWGDSSQAELLGSVRGLPRVDTATWNLDIERMRTNQHDLAMLLCRLGMSDDAKEWVNLTGYVNMGATVRGGLKNKATADITIGSALVNLMAKSTLTRTDRGHHLELIAKANSNKWSAITKKNIQNGALPLLLDVEAEGLWRDSAASWADRIEGSVKGSIKGLWSVVGIHNPASKSSENHQFTPLRHSPLDFNVTMACGRLTATVVSKDSMADFNVSGEWRVADNQWAAEADVQRLAAGLLPEPLSTHLTFEAHGESLDALSGNLMAEKTRYGNLYLKQLALGLRSDGENKTIELMSDIADATISGRFMYQEIPSIVNRGLHPYTSEDEYSDKKSDTLTRISSIAFHVYWKEGEQALQNIAPGIVVARGTRVDGSYTVDEQLKLVARSDSLRLGSVALDAVGILGYRENGRYVVDVEAQEVNIGQVNLMERARITLGSGRERTTLEVAWGNEEIRNHGDLALTLELMESIEGGAEHENERWPIRVEKGLFFVGDIPWELKTDRLVALTSHRSPLSFKGLEGNIKFESGERSIGAKTSLCGLPSDHLELDFDRFNLSLLSDIFLQESPLTVGGDINGHFSLHGINKTPYFNANLMIDSCMVNNQTLDTVRLTSNWNAELNLLNLNLESRQVTAGGHMELGKKETGLHFDVAFNSFELGLVAPFLASFSSLFEGQLHGNFNIGGTLESPLILGEAYVDNGALKLDITNVTYHFSDSIQFDNNEVKLNNFIIEDPLGNTASANGTLLLMNENTVEMDINLTTPNILLLDKKRGEGFYGRLLASADGRVRGTAERLEIDVNARTNTGCELTIPITQQERVKSQHYITFVNDDEPVYITELVATDSSLDYTLNLDLSITPDLKLNLPMDFDEVGADASVSGAGDLHFSLSRNTSPQLMGTYEISSGTMKVSLLSLYEKRFTLENGSSMHFPGNIPDAQFDMKAVYSQRVNLSTLTGSLSNIDNSQKYVQVENIISIAGTLDDPNISFDLNLPNSDQSVEDEVFAYIDRNSERDMLNQTVSLLVNGRFSSVNNNDQSGGSALGLVTSFVGNSLSEMVQFVDVNIDYKAATESTNQHLDVNISKDWGRWYLESTLGYGGESRAMAQSAVSGAVIDALIGYRVSPVFHLYAYNRTNTNDYTRIDLPFKQGAGMKLTKDFDRWGDLFKKRKKK